jgi:hypothetical protein
MSHFYFGWAVGVKSKQNPTGTARPMVPPLNLTIFESGYGEGRCQYCQFLVEANLLRYSEYRIYY